MNNQSGATAPVGQNNWQSNHPLINVTDFDSLNDQDGESDACKKQKNGLAHQRRFASNSPPHNESTTPPPKRDDSPKYRSGTAIMKAKMAEMHMKRHMPQIYLSKQLRREGGAPSIKQP